MIASSIDFVDVAGGTFTMGAACDGRDLYDADQVERPQHEVTLSPYQITVTPITMKSWTQFIDETGYAWRHQPECRAMELSDVQPAVFVSWHDTAAFCRWLNQKDEEHMYALATEAQWERACRGTDGRMYPWGNEYSPGGLSDTLIEVHQDVRVPLPLGRFPQHRSAVGCLDMMINIMEWCRDWWDHYSEVPQIDPIGPTTGEFKVLKGGNVWTNYPRCSARSFARPDRATSAIGFRVVRERKENIRGKV